MSQNYPVFPKPTDSIVTECVAITASSQQYTLPQSGDYYYIIVKDNSVYLKGGANPTATATVGSGHFVALTDGAIFGPIRLVGPKIAYIGDTAGGEVCFVRLSDLTAPSATPKLI